MSIDIRKYVDIVSGAIGDPVVTERELIQRIFTSNPVLPINSFVELQSLEEVGQVFGLTSQEYLRAIPYFAFISKNLVRARKISYAGYSLTARAASIIGARRAQTLSELQAFTTPTITIDIGGSSGTTAAIDLSLATDIDNAMSIIQTAVQGISGAAVQLSGATVSYNALEQRVFLNAGNNDANLITFSSSDDAFLTQLGWGSGVQTSQGTTGDTVTEILTESDRASDNFASFTFAQTLTQDQIVEAATWNHGLNVKYVYCVPTNATNAQALVQAADAFSGTCVTLLSAQANDYTESAPAILAATTDYNAPDSVINYMFHQFDTFPVSVIDTATSNSFDALRVNYNGRTQQAGRQIAFYQRGFLLGPTTIPRDLNTYVNELRLKDTIRVSLLNLLLRVGRVPANRAGALQVLSDIQPQIDRALLNGSISVGRVFTSAERASIISATGVADSDMQVENNGYWVNAVVRQETINSNLESVIDYTLVYANDEIIRVINGTHSLV